MNYEEQIKRVNETNPFMRHNNITAAALDGETARVTAPITQAALNAMQGVHGGMMFIMAETAAGLLARSDGRSCVTVNSSFQFLRGAAQPEELCADAVILKRGRMLCICRSSVRETGKEAILAEGEFTFYTVDKPQGK